MNTVQKKKFINSKNLAFLLLGFLVVYFSVTSIVEQRFQTIEVDINERITQQLVVLTAIAEVTSRNGADAITESIVKDCQINERNTFDNLLGNLDNNLNRSQLIELERLFGRCGSFFSERKSVMVARLSREIEVFEDYVGLLETVVDEDLDDQYSLTEWKELSAAEQKQSELFTKLVTLQDKIISTLLLGKSAQSPEISEILLEVKEVQETLIVTNTQASTLKSSLISL